MTLTTIRDELRLKAHLAGMDARDSWGVVGRRVRRLERKVTEGAEAAATLTIGSFEMAKGWVFEIVQKLRARGH